MSVIGPRPQLVRDMVFMTDEQRMRHTAKPGLSGLAQVNGRNAITWEDKLEWDQKYIKKVGLIEDINIILETVKKAFIKQEGMYYDSKNFIKWPLVKSIKQFSIDIFTIIIGFIVCNQIHMKNIDIISWVLLAFSTIIIFGCIIVAINMIFYREKIVRLLKVIRKGLN